MNRTTLLRVVALCLTIALIERLPAAAVAQSSPLAEKAHHMYVDLLDKHWLDGLYVSIVESPRPGEKVTHTVNDSGNVIHAGVWTGRYLGGVGYRYAVTKDPKVRAHGGEILKALRILQEVTGKPGLLARGYVKGHGPVNGWERDGAESKEWHQGQGDYAGYRWYGDVSVDNFNAVLYGYAIYYDLAADDEQKLYIAYDVDRLMTHLLDNDCRIIDVDDEPTEWGHVGIDPDPARVEYYNKFYESRYRRTGGTADKAPLRSSLMLLPDLLIAHRITGKQHYKDFYDEVVARFRNNPEPDFYRRQFSPEALARTNHSSEGQSYEAMYNLVRYEQDPELLKIYRSWVSQLWEFNWMEGNSVFTYMTLALLPDYREADERSPRNIPADVPHAADGAELALQSLRGYPGDRVLRPVMNSLRTDIEINTAADRFNSKQSGKPLPMADRPLDNEYCWKGSPYQLDGWLKPAVAAMAFSFDDPQVAWFCDGGRLFRTLDRGETWQNMNNGLMGAGVQNVVASKDRTFVIWGQTGNGVYLSRDGGMSWRPALAEDKPEFVAHDFSKWLEVSPGVSLRIDESSKLVRSTDGGKTSEAAMNEWRIPLARSVFATPWGIIASGPGGVYRSDDGIAWEEQAFFPESETGGADYLHAYWMGRYYGFIEAED